MMMMMIMMIMMVAVKTADTLEQLHDVHIDIATTLGYSRALYHIFIHLKSTLETIVCVQLAGNYLCLCMIYISA